jgi:hypothetical protein
MLKKISVLALVMAAGLAAGSAYGDDSSMQAGAAQPAQRPTARRANSVPPTLPWPAYANYGNVVGRRYSKAAGLREGQVFGTFGARPADARARGSY